MSVGLPKQTALHLCFSRDGRSFVPRDEADIAPSGWGSGKWDTGYLSSIGGICTVSDDELRFYYTGLRGDGCRLEQKDFSRNGMYSNGAIGYATLRRDGFAGLVADACGEMLTNPVVFSGSHLFVNADCRFGTLSVGIIGADGKAIPGFTAEDCQGLLRVDSTKAELVWKGGSIAVLSGTPVQFRFVLRCGTLYSFWVSASEKGASGGYVAAGGPAYAGVRDT